jgi:ABC-type antimicrobial peptide transport system permease subunit
MLLRMLGAEALLIAAVGTVIGSTVGAAASTAFSTTLPGSPLPTVSPLGYGLTVAGALALTILSIMIMGTRAIGGRAVESVAGRHA